MFFGVSPIALTISKRSTVWRSICCTATIAVSSPKSKPPALAQSNNALVTSRLDECGCDIAKGPLLQRLRKERAFESRRKQRASKFELRCLMIGHVTLFVLLNG